MTETPDIKYPDRLAGLAQEFRAWVKSGVAVLRLEGATDEEIAERLTDATPKKFIEVITYEAAYLGTVEAANEQVAAGELIDLGNGTYRRAA